MNNKIKTPELLCPAGSVDAFRAAIEGGADAIYVGGTEFNARINAKNFTEEELRESVALAHSYGVKVYVAANTLIYDQELDRMLRAAETAYLCGADALILADVGAATQIKKRIPIELHASTQLSGHNSLAAKYLQELGFSRMVCAREMSRDDLASFVKSSPIEAEAFVHGALCVCHSGQCLFSSLVGGRSGNRGECAQPCRLPFKNGNRGDYPLSLKDLSLARHVPELCDMGIASFKIEGRMKSPEYVRDVARVWRHLIDERRGADDRDMAYLAGIFSRGGFTDGYYSKKVGMSMMGIRSDDDKKSSRTLTPFEKIERKLPVDMEATLRVGESMSLNVTCGDRSVTVEGAVPEAAVNAPLSAAAVEKNLVKLGNTPYVAQSVKVNVEGEVMVPISSLNALRRSAIDALAPKCHRSADDFYEVKSERPKSLGRAEGRTAYFHYLERIPEEAYGFFDLIYVPIDKYDGRTEGAALPAVIYDSETEDIRRLIKRAGELGCKHLLVGNVGHIALAEEAGMTAHGDFRLNVCNSETAAHYDGRLCDVILSPELTMPKLRDVCRAYPYSRVTVYGRIPLMVTEKCVGKEISDCTTCNEGRAVLTDRRGVSFPVLRDAAHRSIIVNSVPTYMADKADELLRYGIRATHFIFTNESSVEISRVITSYRRGLAPKGDVRRIK